MMLAARYGLLRADIDEYGIPSVLREVILLDMLNMEQSGKMLETYMTFHTMLISPNIDLKKFTSHAEKLDERIERMLAYKGYDLDKIAGNERLRQLETDSLLELWQKLKSDGTIERAKEEAAKKIQELKEKKKKENG